jgi:hypothetical protein
MVATGVEKRTVRLVWGLRQPCPVTLLPFHRSGTAGMAARLTLAWAIGAIGCGSLGGPGAPERSIEGTYQGSWHFGIYDPDTIARGNNAPPNPQLHGSISCPAEFRVSSQDDRSIRGDFALSPPGPFSACVSQRPGFCSDELIATFCRQVSGTLEGEAFSTGSPEAKTILFTFRMRIANSEGRAALSRFLGCTVVAEEKDVFSGGVTEDVRATAFVDATALCAQPGLERVDLSIRLEAARVAQ